MLHLKPVSIMWSLLARDLYLRNLISKTITQVIFLSLIYLNILICRWLSWQWFGSVPVVCIFVSHLTHLYAIELLCFPSTGTGIGGGIKARKSVVVGDRRIRSVRDWGQCFEIPSVDERNSIHVLQPLKCHFCYGTDGVGNKLSGSG